MEKMEIKPLDEYSLEEKLTLLRHWWFYYGKMLVTYSECERFESMIASDPDTFFAVASLELLSNRSSQVLISAMRTSKLEEYLTIAKKVREEMKKDNLYDRLQNDLITILVSSYNDPEPSVPMTDEEIVGQIIEMESNKNKGNQKNI